MSAFKDLSPADRDLKLTALALGEITSAEAAEIEAAMAQDPALALTFNQRKRAAASLRDTVASDHGAIANPPIHLSDDRREKLLALFKTPTGKAAPRPAVLKRWYFPLSMAAVLAGLLLVAAAILRRDEKRYAVADFESFSIKPNAVRSLEAKSKRGEAMTTESIAGASPPRQSQAQLAAPRVEEAENRWHFNQPQEAALGESLDTKTPYARFKTGGVPAKPARVEAEELAKERGTIERLEAAKPREALGSRGVVPNEPANWSDSTFAKNDADHDRRFGLADGPSLNRLSDTEVTVGGKEFGSQRFFYDANGPATAGDALERKNNAQSRDGATPSSDRADASIKNPASASMPSKTDYFFGQDLQAIPSPVNGTQTSGYAVNGHSDFVPPVTTDLLNEYAGIASPQPGSGGLPAIGQAFGGGRVVADQTARQRFGTEPRSGGGGRGSVTREDVLSQNSSGQIQAPLASQSPLAAVPETPEPAMGRRPAAALKQEVKALEEQQISPKRAPGNDTPPPGSAPVADPAPKPAASTHPTPQPEILTRDNRFSTFSLNVADVSFRLAAAALERGAMPDASNIRAEEFINAFDYRDPQPGQGAAIAFAHERARHPFAHNRDALRLSIKTAAQGRETGKPLNIVVLLDNSGSMERADRVRIINEALGKLAGEMRAEDKLSLVTFARTARLWFDGVSGAQAAEVAAKAGSLTPEGGTNLEEALRVGYEAALRHLRPGTVNRVVLLTDGAANLGDVNANRLRSHVERHRTLGVALDCFGIGWEGYNDDLLEELSRNGDGRYAFINTPEEAATDFVGQLAGALRVAASDVKVQVEFNPRRVSSHRQVGYAKHQLTKEQFRDNSVDAAEIGAAEAGNALYVIETNPAGAGDIATVRVRYKVPATGEYKEHEYAVPYAPSGPVDNAAPTLRLAIAAAAFAESLSQNPYAAEVTNDGLLRLLSGVPEAFGSGHRSKSLEWMIRQAKAISGR